MMRLLVGIPVAKVLKALLESALLLAEERLQPSIGNNSLSSTLPRPPLNLLLRSYCRPVDQEHLRSADDTPDGEVYGELAKLGEEVHRVLPLFAQL